MNAPVSPQVWIDATEVVTLTEIIEKLRDGCIYENPGWLFGPAMRALTFAAELEARVMHHVKEKA